MTYVVKIGRLAVWASVAMIAFPFSTAGQKADVIIYGGTSAAVIAAVEVVQSGKSAIIISPDKHLGGLTSGGLGYTDIGLRETIGGLSLAFYNRIWQYYNKPDSWNWQTQKEFGKRGQYNPAGDELPVMWLFEPHVAENIYEQMIREYRIPVFRDECLDRKTGVKMKGKEIQSITTLSKRKYSGKIFIDATYEGDLMAAAGVSYYVGREPCSMYKETMGGVQIGRRPVVQKIDPWVIPGDSTSGIIARVSPEHPGKNCSGDDKIQAYCFRVCMTNHPDNRQPFPKPENYDLTQYEMLARLFEAGYNEWFNKFDLIPNRKTDTNNHGPFSSDNIGMNYDYPEASYERRKEIIQEHQTYQKGLLYFVANDKRVPEGIRAQMNQWGLAKDEFKDNDNWPYQLYIREARRMIGEYVMTEHDIVGNTRVADPIGMGSYGIDSHNVQRFIDADGFVQHEGSLGINKGKPYPISLRSIMPRKEECNNLLVPVCLSSSHVAFGSIRMEPVFMVLGQSTAAVACQAIDEKEAVQDISYARLRKKLLDKKQVLEVTIAQSE